MPLQIQLKSKEQYLGDIIRSILNDTDLNDISPGSDLATVAEAMASAFAQLSTNALKILENTSLESLVGDALDKKAESIRLPNGQGGYGRKPAISAVGPVTIGSSFSKISSKLYAGKPSPFSGSSILYMEDASQFPVTGQVYIGRGTIDRFEGPIGYTSIVNNGSFWTMTLATPMTKNHLQSDLVTLAQGGDRFIPAGTSVLTKANSGSPAIEFQTVSDLSIPDGEAEGTVNVVCTQSGEIGNVLGLSITNFATAPFAGATVTNPSEFRSGKSSENDEDLRERIKTYPSTLSRGTVSAIQAFLLGATDPETGRTIQSTNVLDPVEPGDSAKIFIDDGTGLEPSFDGQAYELLLANASGQEKRFRAAQFPITPATLIGSNFGPFVLRDGLTLTVQVDDIIETYTINPANYQNLLAATGYEIARDLNAQANIVGFRTLDSGSRIVVTDLSGEGEVIKTFEGEWQSILGLPLAEIRPIFVYKNSNIQSFRGKTATLETRARSGWSLTVSDLTNVRVAVDGVIQTISITDTDFAEFGTNIASATVTQYATVLSRKVAGVKFTVSGQILIWSTYQTFSPNGSLEILETKADGTPAGWIGDSKMWRPVSSGGTLSDVGAVKDFSFNRFTGEINFVNKPNPGDVIEIASRNTRAFIPSLKSPTGLFNLAPLPATVGNAKLIVGFDGDFAVRTTVTPASSTITPSEPDAANAKNVLRLTANNTSLFANVLVGDFLYLVKDETTSASWNSAVSAFYRIKNKGNNKYATNTVFNTLPISVNVDTSVPAQVFFGESRVVVSKLDHGLKTGDIITISTATAIGGISAVNLSVTNAVVTVLSSSLFQYTALASATSSASGTLATVGYNHVTVTQTGHGFANGALVSFSAAAAVGGISAVNLSVANAAIEVLSANTYKYRALAAATSDDTGNLTTATYQADAYVEFEVSTPQRTAWNALLGSPQAITSNSLNFFYSTVVPQIIDFGVSLGAATVDDIVSEINNQVSTGMAEKVSPTQLQLISEKYERGSVAVLAVIGNASSVFSAGVDTSIQAHVGSKESSYAQSGTPVVSDIETPTLPASGYPTRTYLKIDKDLIDVTSTTANPAVQASSGVTVYPEGFQVTWITGRQYNLSGRVYNNQTTAPFLGLMRSEEMISPVQTSDSTQTTPDSLNRYANYAMRFNDLVLNNYDKLVVEMDLDPTDKTIQIPAGKTAKIQDMDTLAGSGKGQVISFRLKDPEDANKPFFDPTSVYKDFDFSDFKMLTHSVGLYREDVSDRALVLRSVDYGSPNRMRLSIRYPDAPDVADFILTHTTSYTDSDTCLNLIVTLPSQNLIAGSLVSAGIYSIDPSASGTLFNWRISHPTINSGSEYVAGNVLNISGSATVSGSYKITSASYQVFSGASASVTSGSNIVTVTQPAHGLQSGDIIGITTSVAIGGISSVNLSVAFAEVTYINANSFSYEANASAGSNASGFLDTITSGIVNIIAPFDAGLSGVSIFDAAVNVITSYPLLDKTWQELATAINAYYPENPIATAVALGSNFALNPIAEPTYVVYPASTPYNGSDISGAFNWHSFSCKKGGQAGIWQYDSSNPTLNNIKATVQSDDAIFPTTSEASGTSYQPTDEEVYIVPTNSKTLAKWLEFKASSSLNILADVSRVSGDAVVQINSKQDGSDGAVKVTGVSANQIATPVVGNATVDGESAKISILAAEARGIMRGSLVKVQNTLTSELLRPYRSVPTGASITVANTTSINSFLRPTNSIKYIRLTPDTVRVLFLRNGMGVAQTEPLDVGNDITLTNLGSGLVQVTSSIGTGSPGSGLLSARVGDMMYIQPGSPFAVDAQCPAVPSSGQTPSADPKYIGYPVVHVIDDENIIVIAPNITTFGTTTLTSATDLVFMPSPWAEKNIRTNHREGVKYDQLVNNGEMYYLIKTLGNGLVSLWAQNSAAENTDTMLLDMMSVSTDDYVILGDGFDPANQGQFKIVAHNGRNHIVFYNPAQGRDEIVDPAGDRKWRVGPINDGVNRSLRIIAGESVKIGDLLRISTPVTTTQWFNAAMIGSWEVIGIGFSAFNFTGPLPHSYTSGSYDQSKICPFVDISLPNAPIGVVDTSNVLVDNFLVAGNDTALGFTEGAPYEVYRIVQGHAVNGVNPELSDVYLVPRNNPSKITDVFGSVISVFGKLGFSATVGQGIDGYKFYTGLVQQAHRIVDGLPKNAILYPGVKAAGSVVDIQTPLIKSVQISLRIKPKDGVTLNTITDLVKSSVSGYVNSLGVGQPVVLSEVVRIVQGLPGVFSVTVTSTTPAADDDRITVAENEKAFILNQVSDITVG